MLTPRQFGIYAIALATQGVLFAFTAFSVGAYVIRATEIGRDLLRRTFTVNAALALCLLAALQVAAWVSDIGGAEPEIGRILRILSVGPVFGAFEFIPSALLSREMNYRALSIAGMLRVVTASSLAVVLATLGFGATSLAVGQVVGIAVSAAMLSFMKRREIVLLPLVSGLGPILRFGFELLSISGVAQLGSKASDLILGHVLGLAALGLYARASTISSMIFENIYGLVTGVLFSKMSADLREKGTIHGVYLRSLRLITGTLWPALIGIAVLSRPLVLILYGERWLPAALPLSLLMIAQFISLGFAMNLELFVLRGETSRQVRIETGRAVAGVGIFSIGTLFGIGAAALGRIAESLLGYVLYRPHMERLAGLAPTELKKAYGESLILTVAAVTPSAILMAVSGWNAHTSIAAIGAAVLAGSALWFFTLVTRDHVIIQEIRILFEFLRKGRSSAPA